MDGCSAMDTTLALVFDPPAPKRFPAKSGAPAKKPTAKAAASSKKEKAPVSKEPAHSSSKLNVQNLGDHVSDMKIAVYEGLICSTYYFVKYLIHWRCFMLSLPVFVGGVCIYL